ncbi:MAG: heterocyst differentiation protein HetZ [Coleofasciculaceae cyanobacterium RL_1_1]|nr:heterocyst differentiation protein HetZ [Coleofasciculaceae cyanobacterium RL_1_1]
MSQHEKPADRQPNEHQNQPIDNATVTPHAARDSDDVEGNHSAAYSTEQIETFLFDKFQAETRANVRACRTVALRITEEVDRTCTQSQRIQASGDIQSWAMKLAIHRLHQVLKYYGAGSRGGRLELHSTLSAIIYRYITPIQVHSSYQARLVLIEDFLQNFYVESLNALRREAQLDAQYSPRSLLELAEYMAFTERYAKRRISLSRSRSQQLVVLRAQTFAQHQPPEQSLDIEQALEGRSEGESSGWQEASHSRVRDRLSDVSIAPNDVLLRQKVIDELIVYLESSDQSECADYFVLRLQDLPTHEIEAILGLTPRERDYLQQRFKYHLIRFALSHHWELVHQWLDADIEKNLGMTSAEWEHFQAELDTTQVNLLRLKQAGLDDATIARQLSLTSTQMKKRWFELLKIAWEFRNR